MSEELIIFSEKALTIHEALCSINCSTEKLLIISLLCGIRLHETTAEVHGISRKAGLSRMSPVEVKTQKKHLYQYVKGSFSAVSKLTFAITKVFTHITGFWGI